MREDVTVARVGAEAVDGLRDLFLALHRHHRAVVDLPLVADDEAWRARRATYLAWFAEGRALLFVASASETPVGYALLVWHEGADDTFPLAPRYAEIYTLSVAEAARGAGVGNRLLDAVDEALAREGDPPLTIAVMACNSDALRFYARRGLVPGELVLYRFPGARTGDAGTGDPDP
jgi:GNAT superfamily N-acetyltransferase